MSCKLTRRSTNVLSPCDSSSSGVGGKGLLGAPLDPGPDAPGVEPLGEPSATAPNPGL